jgi:hypothetical protein
VVGLYLDPPERALVLSLDEKSQIQALDRTQPGLRGREQEQEEAQREFNWVASVLDLLLEPDTAEEAIGDLAELYVRRRAVNPGHAKRWLIVQFLWIVFGRAMDVFGRFMRARAGK